jgi:hypothetical protein
MSAGAAGAVAEREAMQRGWELRVEQRVPGTTLVQRCREA